MNVEISLWFIKTLKMCCIYKQQIHILKLTLVVANISMFQTYTSSLLFNESFVTLLRSFG